jgi:hypothetical protein
VKLKERIIHFWACPDSNAWRAPQLCTHPREHPDTRLAMDKAFAEAMARWELLSKRGPTA